LNRKLDQFQFNFPNFAMIRKATEGFQWEGVEVLPYKETGTHFKSISRQTLFTEGVDIPVELRYFEILEDGYSTLERHEHEHVVMVIRGRGEVFVGSEVTQIGLHDIVHIPPMTWHQFRANRGEPLGILCLVSCERDRPQRPESLDLESLQAIEKVGDFIRV
jgi:mannose-6-phosphate isomerase-like protein (cupin superfamily)